MQREILAKSFVLITLSRYSKREYREYKKLHFQNYA